MHPPHDWIEETLKRHVRALAVEIGERSVFRGRNLARAEAYIRTAFEQIGLSVDTQAYDYDGLAVANLIATLPDAGTAASYYLVGAHYDTVVGSPGADDNASAIAVMLALAEAAHRKPPEVPLRFAAFTLEEPPAFETRHQGSRVFARARARAGDQVLGAVVLEMVGYTSARQHYPLSVAWMGYPRVGNFIGIVGNRRSRAFGRSLIAGMRRNPDLPVESIFLPFNGRILPVSRWSDHASFWDRGWPAVMVTDTAFLRNPNYHMPSDTMATLDFAFMGRLVHSLELALAELPTVAP